MEMWFLQIPNFMTTGNALGSVNMTTGSIICSTLTQFQERGSKIEVYKLIVFLVVETHSKGLCE
ncbi:ADM_collapsed_G0005140.mRNA.1.CDS.1 [Saccharomyces cerevisiae]|nr:ADM_collapsed_G0005140.mRNA.1.CDS.1 [Saccharomyces cerevisiae]